MGKRLFLLWGIVFMFFISCSTVGQYLPLSSSEIVTGAVQTTFAARDSWLSKKEIINTQAYIKLLEAAVQKYPGDIDIRDIMWIAGRKLDSLDTEITAYAKVIKKPITEKNKD